MDGTAMNLTDKIDRFFKISERGSSIKTEILAGATTFMTMVFLVAVHPAIMAGAGMDKGAMATVTLLTAAIFTALCGLYCNIPFALATAMGTNGLFAFSIVASGAATWQTALGINFISGMIFVLITVCGIREKIILIVPKGLKITLGAVVGIFIAATGLCNVKLVALSGSGFLALGDVMNGEVGLFTITLVLILVFTVRGWKAGIIIAMAAGTIIGIPMGLTGVPEYLVSMPPSIMPIAFKLDIRSALSIAYIPFLLVFFVNDFFSTLGTLLGCAGKAELLDEDGNLPDMKKPFLVDAVGTVAGTVMGTSTVTTYVQSAAGIEAGGRTGLTSVCCAAFFLLSLFFTPIALMVPNAVNSAALVVIGVSMLTGMKDLDYTSAVEYLPAFIAIVGTAYTYNLATGLSLGIIAHIIVMVSAGRIRQVHWTSYVLAVPLAYYLVRLA